MNKFDELIDQALSAEDRELLARHGEPGYVSQALGMFRGPWSWVMWLLNVVGGVAFVIALCALWQVYTTTDVLTAVRSGVAGLVLLQFTVVGKGFMGAHLEANRVLREVKRVELQLALLRSTQGMPQVAP